MNEPLSDAEMERMKAQLAAATKTRSTITFPQVMSIIAAAPANMAALIGEVERLRLIATEAQNVLDYFGDDYEIVLSALCAALNGEPSDARA